MIIEEWKDIEGYEGLYQVSNLGRVKTIDRIVLQKSGDGNSYQRVMKGRMLKQVVDSTNYYRVGLSKNGVVEDKRVHNLVAEAFLGKNEDKVVDHINRNKQDNRVENLRYIYQTENVLNRKIAYRPSIRYEKGLFILRFQENGKRKQIGKYSTYVEAENKYKELYEKRQNNIDSKWLYN